MRKHVDRRRGKTEGQLLDKHAQIAKAEQERRKASEELDDCHKRRERISDEILNQKQILENCNVALESADEIREKAALYKQLSEHITELEKDVLNHDNAKRNLAGYNADIQNCQNKFVESECIFPATNYCIRYYDGRNPYSGIRAASSEYCVYDKSRKQNDIQEAGISNLRLD